MRVPEPSELRRIGRHERVLAAGTVLWRIHATAPSYPMPWNGLRTFGPLPGARWDPHPEPAGDHSPLGAAYFGFDLLTCIAEVYQDSRFIDVETGSPYATAVETPRDAALLDLTDHWFLRAGAKAALAGTERKSDTRAWARAIHEAWPDLDGLVARSSPVGRDVAVFWTPGAFPPVPAFSVPLSHPAISGAVAAAAELLDFNSNAS
ncbi:RES family NAD+ phosphorylase [Arthrobacter halodurans]|uniref:RES family NAD+ phosphorylase n=1 Tax=Arthrobacter halodurans TaxID=516699 RepID=A0ABV4UPW3_9MICC